METFVRYFHILSLLKPYPRRVASTEMVQMLKERGVDDRGLRTIQRDLEKLSSRFPIDGDGNRPRGWCWARGAAVLLPGMDLQTALTFRLMQEFMHPLIPGACICGAELHFTEANRVLEQEIRGEYSCWPEKIQVISRGHAVRPPTVRGEVLDTVYRALFSERRFTATYRRRSGTYLDCQVNPLGIVFVDKSAHLVCTLREYDDIKHMPLHRFESARILDLPARKVEGFSLRGYLRERPEFDLRDNPGTLRLMVSFTPQAAHNLHEAPLSEDQQIREVCDGEVIVSATVDDSTHLRAWLLGFGDQVEVLEPQTLRQEIATLALSMTHRYSQLRDAV